MVFIYILQLEQEKYYIGKTNNPQYRLETHFNSNGSAWTKLYKPIQVIKIIPDCDDYDEDKYTRIYMDKYGIDNVRGGSFVTIELDQSTLEHLKRMNNGTNDKCFKCGNEGHFAKDCEYTSYIGIDETPMSVPLFSKNINFEKKNNMKFSCEKCLYYTNLKFCFENHKLSKAHYEKQNNIFEAKFKCKICEKTYRSKCGYYTHRSTCVIIEKKRKDEEEINKKKKDEEELKKKNKDAEEIKNIIIDLYKQNNEMKEILIELSKKENTNINIFLNENKESI